MKLTVVLGVLVGTLVLACSSAAPAPAEPTPNIDATVEARVAQERAVDATVDYIKGVWEESASQPTATPYPTYTPVPTATPSPKSTDTPVSQLTSTPKPAPTNTPTLVPTPTSVPTPTPRPIPTPTPRPMPTLEPCGGGTSLGNNPKAPPHVFVGAVQVNGRAATDGTEVSAWVDDVEVARTYASGGDYNILIDVCRDGPKRMSGARVSFKIGGRWAAESAVLMSGNAQEISLTQITGIATPTPPPTPTPTPTAVPPTPVPTLEYTYIGPGEGKSQILESDLILTLDKSPYWLTGGIQVPAGLRIVVEKGVALKAKEFGKGWIDLAGSFYAVGTNSQPVVLDRVEISGVYNTKGETKVTVANATLRLKVSENLSAEVTDSVIYRSTFGSNVKKGLIIKRNIFKVDPEYEENYHNLYRMLGGHSDNLTLINNCFAGTYPSVLNVRGDDLVRLIQHNTFDATLAPSGGDWFTMTPAATTDVSIANNYWHGIGDAPTSDFLRDANSDIRYQAKFITSPMLTEPHPDTPSC